MPDLPQGNPEVVPDRQHSWSEYILTDEHGNPKFPEYQSFLFLDYANDGVPSEADRETVESAFQSLEKAFIWGAGEDAHQQFFHDGLFFTISYSPSYFDRFDKDLPEMIDLRPPEVVMETLDEDPSKADDYDAVLHLGTDYAKVLLATELALFGERDELNGIQMDAHLGEVFEQRERRGGFVGEGLPAKELNDDRISEEASLSMGFKSGLLDNLPSEDQVTIEEGPFAGATTKHISKLAIDIESWYDHDREERIERMYSPHHDVEDVGKAGKNVASHSGVTTEIADSVGEDAREHGVVGHTQKLARIRDDNFVPPLLRRGDFNEAHPNGSTLHFGSLHKGINDLTKTLQAMYDIGFKGENVSIDEADDGILSFLDTEARGTYLMPPRDLRALPSARPE